MKTQQQYLKASNECPNCKNDSPVFGKIEDDSNPYRVCKCENCHAEWIEEYRLLGYAIISSPKVELRAVPMKNTLEYDKDSKPIAIPAGELIGYDFIQVYMYNPMTEVWDYLSSYRDVDELFQLTGITRLVKVAE